MTKKSVFIFLSFILSLSLAWSQGIRKAVHAGTFYEKDAERLSQQIDGLLSQAKSIASQHEKISALIVPHAGYVYSGSTAAHAYRLIEDKNYETVVIIGPSHRYAFSGCSIYPQGGYKTPLGVVKIDEPLASELSKASRFKYIPQAHQREHSVEIQIPFIQKTIPEAKIVPIVMGFPTKKTIHTLARAMSKVLVDKNVLVIVSTDMSHYYPKKKANEIDSRTIALIQSLKTDEIIKKLERRENIMCGGGPAVASLLYVQGIGNAEIDILHYSDSAPNGNPDSQVVGYCAAAVYLKAEEPRFVLSSEEKKELIRISQSAIKLYVSKNKILDYQTQNPNFLTKKGAFVTLKKGGRLRGCIGFIESVLPLHQAIIQTSIYAASKDKRFHPVSSSELRDLEIEISVLSPLKKISDPDIIEIGKHGLLISSGDKRGLLLPQVPVENGWSRNIYLQQLCLKAGLPRNAWKSGTDLYVFEAVVFR